MRRVVMEAFDISPTEKDGEVTRERILDVVRRRPGIHKSELSRELGLGWGTISHHVHVLRRGRLLETDRRGRQLLLFPGGTSEEERRWLRALGDDLSAQLIDHLGTDDLGVSEMSRRVGATPKTVRRRLTALRDDGLVERPVEGGSFRLRKDQQMQYLSQLRTAPAPSPELPDAAPVLDPRRRVPDSPRLP